MAKLVYALNQSLDGYVDHMKIGPPDPALFRIRLSNAPVVPVPRQNSVRTNPVVFSMI
jgi:hypothetical protein